MTAIIMSSGKDGGLSEMMILANQKRLIEMVGKEPGSAITILMLSMILMDHRIPMTKSMRVIIQLTLSKKSTII